VCCTRRPVLATCRLKVETLALPYGPITIPVPLQLCVYLVPFLR